MDQNEEMYHHGVPGMHWGVRRSSSQLSKGHSTSKHIIKKESAPEKTSEVEKRKSAKDLSNEELQKLISRKRLENDYNNLYPVKVSGGKKFVDGVFNKVVVPAATEAGKQLAKDFLVNKGKKAMNMPITKQQTEASD